MSDELKLIVPFNEDQTRQVLIMMPFMIIASAICYLSVNYWRRWFIGYYVTLLIQSALVFSGALFLVACYFHGLNTPRLFKPRDERLSIE